MKTNCENTKLSDSAFVRLIGEIILIKHYNHLIIMSIKSYVKCPTTWDVMQSEKLESYVTMSWFTVAWQEFFITRAESGGGEKPCGVMTMSHHCIMSNVQCPLQSCPLSSVQSSLSQWQSPAMVRIARQARRREWGSNILLQLACDSCPVQCCPM